MARADDAEIVWAAWAARQKMPGACKYTKDRATLIAKRLALGYSAEDLVLLIRYAWESDDPKPTFWRGEHHGAGEKPATYLDLANLLVESKLGGRVQAAREWEIALEAPSRKPELRLVMPSRPGSAGARQNPDGIVLEGPSRWRR